MPNGQAAAHEIVGSIDLTAEQILASVNAARHYTAQAGQFVRVLPWDKGELIPLTLADWDAKAGTICLVVHAQG